MRSPHLALLLLALRAAAAALVAPGARARRSPSADAAIGRSLAAAPRMQVGFAGAATTAATVIEEVSRSVGEKGVAAPDADLTFVSMDKDRAGLVDEEGLPLVYDREAIQKYWEGQRGALQSRWVEFLGVAVPFITRVAGLLLSGGTEALESNARELAKDARVNMEKLGPTYIKMGQMMSVRPDILPQAALDELQVLQDGVKGFPTETAIATVEKELGRPLMEVFDEFAEEPVAAASLAQVYKARLRSTGEYVAVKVQRPGVQALVSKDLYVLRRAAEVYQGLVERFAPQQRTDYIALLNEWAVGFYTELDFKNEATNMKRMRLLFEEQNVKGVLVPSVYDEYTTRKVLVSQWVDGVKLSECEPDEIAELIKVGFFHSDPHPGNLIRLNDQSEHKLALIDFGLVAQVRQEDMDSMVSAIVHLANKDYASLVDDFIALKILPDDCNRGKVIPLMDKALSPYVKGGGAKMYEDELKRMYGFDDQGAVGGFQAMTQDMLTVLNDIPFSIPAYFALLARAVVTLEGLALTGDPNYGLIIEAYPFVARKLLSEGRPELQQALQEVLYSAGDSRGVVTPTRLASLLNSAAGIVAKQEGAVFVDLDAVPEEGISTKEALLFLLSPKAVSLRGLLLEEAETAADLLLRQASRKSVVTLASALPQPPSIPFFGSLLPDPMTVAGPLLLPGVGNGAPRPLWVTPQEVLDAVAPKLSREEEIYALSLVDFARSALGDDAAAVLSGDSLSSPLSPLRLALKLLAQADGGPAAASSTEASTISPANRALVARLARQLQGALPTPSNAPTGSAVRTASESSVDELVEVLSALGDEERQIAQEAVARIANSVQAKFLERMHSIS
ncbi:hypothetical protein AB1Y20_009783 [Prymnesium parvum]|uniref:Protein kinase domain-containing protein n=1 Tax=Prymnesium parvum TaxID=97485 RepID=A0AB34K2L3_PRYPA